MAQGFLAWGGRLLAWGGRLLSWGPATLTTPTRIIFQEATDPLVFQEATDPIVFTDRNSIMPDTYTMHPTEVETVVYDFSLKAEMVAGETIASIAVEPSAYNANGADLPTLGAGSISTDGLSVMALFDVTSAEDGEDYETECTILTNSSPPHRLTVGGIIKVRKPATV